MTHRVTIHGLLLLVAASATTTWPAAAHAQLPSVTPASVVATPPDRLLLAGNETALWIGQGQWDRAAKTFVYRFAFQAQASPDMRPVYLRPQEGRIVRWAAVGDGLHVFYGKDEHFATEGTHYRYRMIDSASNTEGARRELPLPGGAIPLAMCGEDAAPSAVLWALVEAATADGVTRDWQELNAAANPTAAPQADGREPVTMPAATTRQFEAAPTGYHVISYDGFAWQPRFPVTSECTKCARVWICGGSDQLYLLWQTAHNDPVIRFARYADSRWHMEPELTLEQPIHEGFAIWLNRQLIFAGLRPSEADDRQLHCTLWHWRSGEGGGWHAGATPLTQADQQPLLLPAGSELSGFVDQLAILKPGEPDPQLSLYSVAQGGGPIQPFEAVRLTEPPPISQAERGMNDLLATMVVAALLLLVFWRRQESIASPVVLPVGLAVASTGRRAMAAFLDMLPACAVVVLLWPVAMGGSLGELGQQIQSLWRSVVNTGSSTSADPVDWPAGLAWAWLIFRVLYFVYGTLFELAWSSTPGKRLLRCEVRTESMERPHAAQTIVRNLTKLIELEPYLRIWPFLLVIFFTRNHQRMGDLLARTLVVERQRLVDVAEDPPDET